MGMHVFGNSPASERGYCFQNTVWSWHPLWRYCENIAPDLIPGDNFGHTNDGWGLDARDALALADRLDGTLASGEMRRYEERYTAELKALPLRPCHICGETGYRAEPPQTGPGPRRCNGCHGTGKVADSATDYPFSAGNAREFAAFLRECGGFQIC